MNLEDLKAYLSQKYQGGKSFLENIIFPIFGETNFIDDYEEEILESYPEYQAMADTTGISSIKDIGKMYIEGEPLQIFDISVVDRIKMMYNRVAIQSLIRRIMDQYSSAFMIFHYADDTRWDWRFTYCRKSPEQNETTDSKRYTFLLGPKQSCRTAAENFLTLYNNRESLEIKDIEEAFNVEALSKEFFGKYKAHYEAFVDYMIEPSNGIRQNFIDTDFDHTGMSEDKIRDREEKSIRDYVKKLLGRIVFLHFLQKKGWLGVPEGEDWGNGDRDFMFNLFQNASERQKGNFLDDVLEGLFSKGLDKNRSQDGDIYDTGVKGFRSCRIPYLNGGLFERDKLDSKRCQFPAEYFENLLTMLSQYNFTIDENDPNDAEVGVDPEMLGRIFENLLEDNKDKGAFYTPKEIVQYMCRESLIAYLQTDQREEDKEIIRQFVTTHDADLLGDLKADIDQKLIDVKICDPAIGSGAFPMGLLRELFFCRSAIEPNVAENAADIKRHIIQNNIYGVDIERGAVDVARLRFWLSLIIDENSPATLPNLDYKIMQGNSLLTTFNGQYVNLDTNEQQHYRVDELKQEKRNLYRLKQQHYVATGDEKLRLDVEIKKTILKLIAIQVGAESRIWLENNAKQLNFFDDPRQLPFTNVKSHLPQEKQQTINLCKELNHQLCDTTIPLIERAQIDIRFFDWRMMFTEVFDRSLSRPSNEGFDIVIGNPPYIQLQADSGKLAKQYEGCGYSTFARTGDIYCLFYERGWQLLKNEGHLCYITSNKWMRAGYGEKTREFFANKTNPKLLIDFAGVKIFESATVDTNILLFSKSKNQHKTVCAVTNKQNSDSVKNLSDFVQQQNSICDFSNSDSWVILSPIEQSIKRKIEAVGTPLKDWDIQINYGIKTGYNDAFIISTEKREEILANCKTEDERRRTDELIRPILRGRDIKRYRYEWANLYLIATFPARHYDIDKYPAVKNYLLSFAESYLRDAGYDWVADNYLGEFCMQKLAQTGKFVEIQGKRISIGNTSEKARKKTSNKWFETQDSISYWEDFNKPKIIYPETTQGAYFAFDKKGVYIDKTCFMLIAKDAEYLQYTLSSRLFEFAYKRIFASVELGEHGYQYNKHALVKLPILRPIANVELKKEKLDDAIYGLYNISEEEIKYIESIEN